MTPDDEVPAIADHALDLIKRIQTSSYRDTPTLFLGPSAYLAALEAIAGHADRLTRDQAEKVLDMFEAHRKTNPPGGSLYTDKSHALACAGIGRTHPHLAERAVDHLLDLLERAPHDVAAPARRVIEAH